MKEMLGNSSYFSKEEIDKMIREDRHLGRENLSFLLSFLKIDENEFKNKKVLDIGSGTGKIVKEMNKRGIVAFGLDPIYEEKDNCDRILKTNENLVAGISDDKNFLPFKESSFDVILNICSTFNYAKTKKVVEKNFNDQLRILRKNGKIYIFPIIWSDKSKGFVADLEDNFIENKDEIFRSFIDNIERLKKRDDLEISLEEPDYFKIRGFKNVPKNLQDKIFCLKIVKK